MSSPAGRLGAVLVDELVRCGIRDAVLAPGSRNAPFALALHAADRAGRLRLHVRVDERSAGFLALGLAKASGVPVPVGCTSGTAAANLHPAVLEADAAGVPLLVLTADRPPELRDAGANQTVDQVKLFGSALRWYAEVGVPEGRGAAEAAYWRTVADRAVAAAVGALTRDPGPVHLNLPVREPLVDPAGGQVDPGPGRPDGGPWTRVDSLPDLATPLDPRPDRTVVVAGDAPGWLGARARALAESAGWPLLAEPSSGARGGPAAVSSYPLLLQLPRVRAALAPERVLVVGRPTISRAVQALLADPAVAVEVRAVSPRWPDPGRRATAVGWGLPSSPPVAAPGTGPADRSWLARWREADRLARGVIEAEIDRDGVLGPLRLARDLVRALPPGALLVAASSLAVRDLDLAAADLSGVRVLANRGAAGIDGTVSTAIGAALAAGGPAYALLGDLALLHDATGLVLGPDEPRPDLCLVVNDNDGGGIFAGLEMGRPEHAAGFERVFATPHGVDLAAWCAATGTAYRRVERPGQLPDALRPARGLRIVHVRTSRSELAEQGERLRAAVAAALTDSAALHPG